MAVEAYALYEQFRPAVPKAARTCGAGGVLDLGAIQAMAKRVRA